jgi:putative transposase
MSRRAYSEINLHFVWHVKSSLPLITLQIEPRLYRFVRNYALKTSGLIFHEIGGIETHVHTAVTIPPTVLISEWIGQVKGASSHYVNHQLANRKMLDWQTGYGVVSFGTKDLDWVVRYIRNQKHHHKKEPSLSVWKRSPTMKMTRAKADLVSTLKRANFFNATDA